MSEIYRLLARLGIGSKYRGYQLTALAVHLSINNADGVPPLKNLYTDISKMCKCSFSSIERNIRTVIKVAWDCNRDLLAKIATYPLTRPPTVTQFIDILSIYFIRQRIEKEQSSVHR